MSELYDALQKITETVGLADAEKFSLKIENESLWKFIKFLHTYAVSQKNDWTDHDLNQLAAIEEAMRFNEYGKKKVDL